MRNSSKLIVATAAAGLVAIGGTAFTAANSVAESVAGYGSSVVSGATATGVTHTLSADGTTIDSTAITFDTAQTGRTVKAAFGTAPLELCVLATDGFTATCTYAVGFETATADAFNVAVS